MSNPKISTTLVSIPLTKIIADYKADFGVEKGKIVNIEHVVDIMKDRVVFIISVEEEDNATEPK